MRKLTDDISALKPTLFPAVPRVLERIQSGIQGKLKAAPWPARALIGLAMRWKLARIRAGRPVSKARRSRAPKAQTPKFADPAMRWTVARARARRPAQKACSLS